jgi:imidazole glycerol-phosphate synthase subunit HisH
VRVVLADYGAGNLRSVASALARAGAEPLVSADPTDVRNAPLVVIAGVGNAASAAAGLEPAAEALKERVEAGRPLLGICVGLQLLFERSDEGAGGVERSTGLGLLRGDVRRLRARTVPHMGWNRLVATRPSALLEGLDGEDLYFAHSYAAEPHDDVATALVEHHGALVAAVESGCVAGVQFHPERSGAAGARFLANALAWSRSA